MEVSIRVAREVGQVVASAGDLSAHSRVLRKGCGHTSTTPP